MPLPPSAQQRDTIKKLSPPWLARGNGEKFMYAAGLALDVLLDRRNQGARAHLPGYADPTQLPLIADDWLITKGLFETNAAFATRLSRYLETWQRAGSSRAMLEQVQAYVQPPATVTIAGHLPGVMLVGGNASYSFWDRVFTDTPIGAKVSRLLVNPPNWNWDGQTLPKRAWLVLFFQLVATGQSGAAASVSSLAGDFVTITGLTGMTAANVGQYLTVAGAASTGNDGTFQIVQLLSASSVVVANGSAVAPDANNGALTWSVGYYPVIGPGPVWGTPGMTWGDPTRSWGLNVPQATIDGVRAIVARWKRASVYVPDMIVAFDGQDGRPGAMFSPYSAPGAGNPDGTWGPVAKTVNGCVVPTRTTTNPFDCFCDGTGVRENCFVPTDT